MNLLNKLFKGFIGLSLIFTVLNTMRIIFICLYRVICSQLPSVLHQKSHLQCLIITALKRQKISRNFYIWREYAYY